MCQDKNEVVDYYRYVNIPGSLRAAHDLLRRGFENSSEFLKFFVVCEGNSRFLAKLRKTEGI